MENFVNEDPYSPAAYEPHREAMRRRAGKRLVRRGSKGKKMKVLEQHQIRAGVPILPIRDWRLKLKTFHGEPAFAANTKAIEERSL